MGKSGKRVVVPFRGQGTKEDLPACSGRPRELAKRATRLLDRVERDLEALRIEVDDKHQHPDRSQFERLVRAEVSREEGRTLIRHLVTGCPRCAAVLRPLIGMADPPRPRRRRR